MAAHERRLTAKLEQFATLPDAEREAVVAACRRRVRRYAAREDLIGEGDVPAAAYVILEGWACAYKALEDGRRQVLAYYIPGDVCALNIFLLGEMDHSIASLTSLTCAEIDAASLADLTLEYPALGRAFHQHAMVHMAIQREWLVNLGQRTALERLGHLMCELYLRQQAVGLTSGSVCSLPLTQNDLAETMGLSAVHVNRTLQELRANNLISLRGRTLSIVDLDALQAASLFNRNYLHLGPTAGPVVAVEACEDK